MCGEGSGNCRSVPTRTRVSRQKLREEANLSFKRNIPDQEVELETQEVRYYEEQCIC